MQSRTRTRFRRRTGTRRDVEARARYLETLAPEPAAATLAEGGDDEAPE